MNCRSVAVDVVTFIWYHSDIVKALGEIGGPSRRATLLALAIAGLAALSTQVLLLRELMVAWRGNEMSLGIALSAWLASAGAGGILYGRLRGLAVAAVAGGDRRASTRSLAAWLLILGCLSPIAVLVARLTRSILGTPAGELSGIGSLTVAAIVSVAPFAFVGGFVFALAISTISPDGRTGPEAVGAAYVHESLGAVAGGALMSFLLLRALDPLGIAFLSTALCATSAVLLLRACAGAAVAGAGSDSRDTARSRRRDGCTKSRTVLYASVGAAALVALASGASRSLDDLSVAAQWRELGFRSQANSVYGRIITTRFGSQMSVYESGVLIASHPDRMSAEETVHMPMLQHPSPRRVLLIGGCIGGSVSEVLKHPSVARVDCVELDPELLAESRRQFGDALTAELSDPRVNVSYGDARLFVKRAAGHAYDVVIVAVPDPTTARLNRFYTAEFAMELRACLAPGGVAGLSVSGASDYVSDELAEMLACLKLTFESAFERVLLTPGDPCHILADAGSPYMTDDPGRLSERIDERALDVAYVRDYYLNDRLSPERRQALSSALSGALPELNSDRSPRGYYLRLLLWESQIRPGRGLLTAARSVVSLEGVALLAVLIAVLGALPGLRGGAHAMRSSVVLSVIVVGVTEMSVEFAALMSFQSLYGYVYGRVALLVAAFMAGLVLGGRLGVLAVRRGMRLAAFIALQAGIAAVPIGLWLAVSSISGAGPTAMAAWSHAFPLVVVAAAVLAGAQFPLAAGLCMGPRDEPGDIGGWLHGADLAGAAVGATLTAVFLLPVLGLAGAMTSLSLLNAGALVALLGAALLTRRSR